MLPVRHLGLAPNRRLPHGFTMQIIIPMTCRPKAYADGRLQRSVRAPATCPVCRANGSLGAHDYYDRDTTDDEGAVLRIWVRRFRCRRCRTAVSCLPRFAQPYLMVNSDTIDAYFNGRRTGLGIVHNENRLQRYWRRFAEWSGQLRDIIGPAFGPVSPTEPLPLWRRLRNAGGGLARCNLMFVRDYGVTFFGTYMCHQRPVRT